MKKILSIAISFLLAVTAFAQNSTIKGTILTGSVADSKTKEAEIYATIQFFSKNEPEKVIAYTMTDENGAFEHSLPSKGEYILYYTNVGKKDLKIEFSLNGEDKYDFGEILVEDDIEALNAASVVAQKPLVKMDVDKITYKVSDDVDSKTNTVLDMLRKVPMVSVDGQDNITVNGSSSFKVYVDGKPNQMLSANPSQILKYMPASSVKNIEVITNPGVRYDAEGAGGILNLTTNTENTNGASAISDGAYGSISVNASNRGLGGTFILNAQKGKFSTGITATTLNQNLSGTTMDTDRTQNTATGDVNTFTHAETKVKIPINVVNLSANYEINDQNIISLTGGFSGLSTKMDGLTSASMSIPEVGKYEYDGTMKIKSSTNSINASADYQHTWKDNPEKNFLVSYQFSSSPSVNNNRNTFNGMIPGMDLTDRKSDGTTNSISHSIQTDYITPLGNAQTFSTGVKYLYRDNLSDQVNYNWNGNEFERTDVGSLKYDFINRIGAVYAEYTGQFGNFGIKAGVRYEYTWQDVKYSRGEGKDFSMRYGNLVPAASMQYNISMTENIGLAYNLRISRPGISYLNPYVNTSDPTQISYGNTDLTTENNHNVSLVYNRFSSKLMINATLRYSFTPESIAQYSFFDKNNVMNTTYGNIVRSQSTGLNAFVMYQPFKQTQIIVNGSVGYTNLRSKQLGQSNSGIAQTILLGLQQTIPFDLRLSLNLIGAGNSISLQGNSNGITMITAGLSRSFLDNKLNASITAIGTPKGLNIVTKSTTTGYDFSTTSITKIPLGQVQASLSWSFGSSKTKTSKKAKKVEIEDNQLNSQSLGESIGNMMTTTK